MTYALTACAGVQPALNALKRAGASARRIDSAMMLNAELSSQTNRTFTAGALRGWWVPSPPTGCSNISFGEDEPAMRFSHRAKPHSYTQVPVALKKNTAYFLIVPMSLINDRSVT